MNTQVTTHQLQTPKLYFRNPGEIDIRAATILGVNLKPGENPIGHFGTGLKYVIAGVLRLGGSIQVWSGEQGYGFVGNLEKIRGEDFQLIYMGKLDGGFLLDETSLGFTTDLGKDWEPWMLVRELLSNTKDEGGTHWEEYLGDSSLQEEPAAGETLIVVQCPPLLQDHRMRKEFWLEGETPLWSNSNLEIYSDSSASIYYHGIRATAKDQAKAWNFRFNLLGHLALTEDRTFASLYDTRAAIAKALVTCTDRGILQVVLSRSPEDQLDFDWHSVQPSEEFVEEVLERIRRKLAVPASARAMAFRARPREVEKAELAIPDSWPDMLAQAPGEAPKVIESKYAWEKEMNDRMEALEAQANYWRGCAESLAQQISDTSEAAQALADACQADREEAEVGNDF